jgi:hypothetical protein
MITIMTMRPKARTIRAAAVTEIPSAMLKLSGTTRSAAFQLSKQDYLKE